MVIDDWGYYEVDYIDVTPAAVHPPKPPPATLSDPAASDASKKLMAFLVPWEFVYCSF
jgi:mannan endo-1,4-beta-mannosidase